MSKEKKPKLTPEEKKVARIAKRSTDKKTARIEERKAVRKAAKKK